MMLHMITPPDHTPVSNGSGATGSIPGITKVSETRIRAGKITGTKLIRTIMIEKRNTIHGIMVEVLILSAVFSFDKIDLL